MQRLFLGWDWAAAEYLSGEYDPEIKKLTLKFVCHEVAPYAVKIYSMLNPESVSIDGREWKFGEGWRCDTQTGWLAIGLSEKYEQIVDVVLGDPIAPLHPYFRKVE